MYRIKEVAERFHISPNALRFYENKGLLHPTRAKNGYRMYCIQDVSRIQMILLYRQMGFSVSAIAELLEQSQGEGLADLFFAQYDMLSRQLHSWTAVRDSLGECLERLLTGQAPALSFYEDMAHTAELIDRSNAWKDHWNFDGRAESYDEDVRRQRSGLDFYAHYDKVLEATAREVCRKRGQVVEIGVGTGNLAGRILPQCPILGIDQSAHMLQVVKRKLPSLPVRLGTFLCLPLEDRVCDTVVTSYSFHHCSELEKRLSLREMDRVLRPGGRIIITDLMFESAAARDLFERGADPDTHRDLADEYFSNVDGLEESLAGMGYLCRHARLDSLIWMVTAEK